MFYEENGTSQYFAPLIKNIEPGVIYNLLAKKLGGFEGNVIDAYLNVKERFVKYEA